MPRAPLLDLLLMLSDQAVPPEPAPPPRPPGLLVWLHVSAGVPAEAVGRLVARLGEERADLSVLLTGAVALPDAQERLMNALAPADSGAATARFLSHWQPTLFLWAGAGTDDAGLWPRLMRELHRRAVPVVLAGAVIGRRNLRRWRWWPGRARAVLAPVVAAFAGERSAVKRLIALGMAPERVALAGPLRSDAEPPACDIRARQQMAARLEGRPVWLAAEVWPDEEHEYVAAQRLAQRSARRLLLVLAPCDPGRGALLASALRAEGLGVAQRSAGEIPGPATTAVVADNPGEIGLWYRLAPVSVMGGTFGGGAAAAPWAAAALGSAILHGPNVGARAAEYAALDRAGAATLVPSAEALGEALVQATQPEEAARLAHAAWDIASEAAEVTERVVAASLAVLPPAAVP